MSRILFGAPPRVPPVVGCRTFSSRVRRVAAGLAAIIGAAVGGPAGAAQFGVADAVRYALDHNPDVVRARAGLTSARAESIAAAGRLHNPQLETEYARGGDTILKGTDWSFSLGVSQTFETGGKRAARRAVAAAQGVLTRAEIRQEERRIELAVRDAFRRLGAFAEKMRTLEANAALDREVADAIDRRAREGVLTRFTARLTRMEAARSEGALQRARGDAATAGAELRGVMGLRPGEPAEFTVEPLTLAALTVAPSESLLVQYALRQRPDLAPLRQQLAVAEAQRRLAIREARPDPTVGLGFETDRQRIDGSDVRGTPAVTSGISEIVDRDNKLTARLTLPLPLVNRNQAGRARAEAAAAIARADMVRREAAIRTEVAAARARDERARQLLATYRSAIASARGDLALLRDAYRSGRINLEDYLTDKGRIVDALDQWIDAAEQAVAARAQLESAVGAPIEDVTEGER